MAGSGLRSRNRTASLASAFCAFEPAGTEVMSPANPAPETSAAADLTPLTLVSVPEEDFLQDCVVQDSR